MEENWKLVAHSRSLTALTMIIDSDFQFHHDTLSSVRSILDLVKGDVGCISEIKGAGSIRQRLLDMGLLPKQQFCLRRVAPSGAPVWIELNGTHLALRRAEAAAILVE